MIQVVTTTEDRRRVTENHASGFQSAGYRARALLLLPFLLLTIAILTLPLPFSLTPTTRHFQVISSQFQFEPGVLRVNRGDTVIITLTATDVVHGLYLDEYGLSARVEPGQSETIQFVADQSGKFRYRCSVSCGAMHTFMLGELVVGPNTWFGRAVALMLLVVAGVSVYLWRFPPHEPGETSQ